MMHLNRLKIRKRSPYRGTSRRLHMLCRFNDELLLLSHCDGGNDIIHLETQPDSHEHIIGIVMLDYYNWFIDYIGWMELLWHHDSVCEWQERECKGHTAE
eukprot:872121_1